MASDMKALIEAMQNIVSRPEQSRAIVDEAIRQVQVAGQRMVHIAQADADAAYIARFKSTPREVALSEIGRLLFLEMLNQHVKFLKQHAMGTFQVAGQGPVSPGTWVLRHLRQVTTQATEIDSNLRRLSAVEGVDAAIYATLAAHVGQLATSSLDAALATNGAPVHFHKDINRFLLYAETRVVWTILWTAARRYSRAGPFNLSKALMTLMGELALNDVRRASRMSELTKLYTNDPSSPAISAYYKALFRQIAAGA